MLLEEGQVFQVEKGVFIEVLENSPEGTSLLVSQGNFKALIPGGVRGSDLMDNPALRYGVTVVMLNSMDQDGSSSEGWNNLKPMAVIFNDSSQLAPVPGWLNSSQHGTIEVISDGVKVNFLGSE